MSDTLQTVLLDSVRVFCDQIRTNADIFTICSASGASGANVTNVTNCSTKLQMLTTAFDAILANVAQNNTTNINTQIDNWVKKCAACNLQNNALIHDLYKSCIETRACAATAKMVARDFYNSAIVHITQLQTAQLQTTQLQTALEELIKTHTAAFAELHAAAQMPRYNFAQHYAEQQTFANIKVSDLTQTLQDIKDYKFPGQDAQYDMFKMASAALRATEPVCNALVDKLLIDFTVAIAAAFTQRARVWAK